MALQQKALLNTHNIMSLTAAQTAKFARECEELSNDATVLLFAKLVMAAQDHDYPINYNSPPAQELVKSKLGWYNPETQAVELSGIVSHHMEACIAEMVATAGSTLLPQPIPTTMHALGHKAVKGESNATAIGVRQAETVMRNTAFTISTHIQSLAIRNMDRLSKEDQLVFASATSTALTEEFYYPISYDYRGRMYYRGGMLNPQGSDLNKALHRFAKPAPLGAHGFSALCLSMADAMGIKGTKRSAMDNVLALDLGSIANGDMLEERKTTLTGFQAAGLAQTILNAQAWRLEHGTYSTFETGIVVHQDATCSGLQIAAAVTGHRPTAIATNCTAKSADGEREDVYYEVADICAQTDTEIGNICRTYGRAAVKKAVMTLGYGAGRKTLIKSVGEFLKLKDVYDGEPSNWVMDDKSQKVFFKALEAKCGATTSLMQQLMHATEVADVRGQDQVAWETEDGFIAIQGKEKGTELELGDFKLTVDSEYDLSYQRQAIAPNVVHSIDACQMRIAVRKLGTGVPVACIHDSLGTRPSDYWAAATAVREAFIECGARDTVESFLNNFDINLEILGDYTPEEALKSSYFWC